MSLTIPDRLDNGKPTKFIDVPPGSTIQIVDNKNPQDTWKGIAIDVIPEYGSGRIPAIVYIAEGEDSPRTLTGSGRYTVTVLTNSKMLRELGPVDENVIHARSKPIEIDALLFDGTTDSARACMLFAAGRAAIKFDRDATPPQLTILGATPQTVLPGQYVIIGEHGVSVCSANDFATDYEVLS